MLENEVKTDTGIMSPSIGELATALCAFQQEITGVAKNAKNPFYNSKYADLGAIWQTIREPLTKHGLAVIQLPCGKTTDAIMIKTILIHTSGEYIGDYYAMALVKDKGKQGGIVAQNDPQTAGTAITYARRYALAAILGIHQEDDDANKFSSPPAKEKTEMDVEQKALHDSETKAYKLKLFTADEIKNFNKDFLGVEAVAKCKSKSKLEKASVRFDIWTAQRRVHILMEEVIPQPNHQHNWLNKVLGADSPYAVDDTDKLDMAYADLVVRREEQGLIEMSQDVVL